MRSLMMHYGFMTIGFCKNVGHPAAQGRLRRVMVGPILGGPSLYLYPVQSPKKQKETGHHTVFSFDKRQKIEQKEDRCAKAQ